MTAEPPSSPPLGPLDPTRTALVLVDLQMGIAALPAVPVPASAVVANAARLARACRDAGMPVVLVRVTPSPDGGDALRPPADAPGPVGAPPAGFADIVAELGPEPGDMVVTKRQWGAFYGTELDLQLRRRGVETIILGGLYTDVGVESTARAAYERGYAQVFASDAMAARSAAGHAHAVDEIFPRIGRVRRVDEIVAAVQSGLPSRGA